MNYLKKENTKKFSLPNLSNPVMLIVVFSLSFGENLKKLSPFNNFLVCYECEVNSFKVTEPTDHCWQQQYEAMEAEEPKRLTRLEQENAQLKMLLAEAKLEKAMREE